MNNINISEDDAKKIIEILSKAFKFIVCSRREYIENIIGTEVIESSDTWSAELKWSDEISTKWSDTVYVTYDSESKTLHDKICLNAKCLSKQSAYAEIARLLSGANLERYNNKNDQFEVVCELPKFSSLSELKMNCAIKGIDCA